MPARKPSTTAWIVVHLLYPLLPVPIEGFIRWAVGGWRLNLDTFSAATLAISAGLLSVFINQSLRTQEDVLPDEATTDSRNGACVAFMASGMCFFILFGLVVLMYALVNDGHMEQLRPLLEFFQKCVFVSWIVPVVSGVVAQKAFKLRASAA